MTPADLSWIDALAIFHGGTALGMSAVTAIRYFGRVGRREAAMLLWIFSYAVLTILNVRAIVTWATPTSPWFWISLAAWIAGDAALGLHLVFGRIPERSGDWLS